MDKLEFEYDGASGELIALAPEGFRVRIVQDSDAANPFKEWDCEPPLLSASFGHGGRADLDGDSDLLRPFRSLSDGRLVRHWRKLAALLDGDADKLHAEAKETQRDGGGKLADIKRDMLEDMLDGMNTSDQMEAAAAVWNVAGIEALCTSSQGYSQGDYSDLLLVATPEWAAKVGAPRDTHKRQLESAAKLWGYWAWGDVYGYVIEDASGKHVDSCWGYYHDSIQREGFTESGMAESLLPALESAIADKRAEAARDLEAARPDMYAGAES